jgi:hypothetical protein
MKGIHVNWTAPFFHKERLRGHGFKVIRKTNSNYTQPDYQTLYTILSALYWKKYNGPIKLYTDKVGLDYYVENKLDTLYDEINTETLNKYTDIDPAQFWTSGKIHCLQFETAPFTFLDQDFIIKGTLPSYVHKKDIVIGHWEIPRGYYHFSNMLFEKEITHTTLPPNYNIDAWIPNTSFITFNNLELVQDYVKNHNRLVNTKNTTPEWFWLLTDQGILGHCIREGRYSSSTLTDKIFLSDSNYSSHTNREKGLSEAWYYPIPYNPSKESLKWEHVWLAKVVYGTDPELLQKDCRRFYREIWEIFPQYRYLLENLKQYHEDN